MAIPACIAEIFTSDVLTDLRRLYRPPNPYDFSSQPIRKRHEVFSEGEPSADGLRAVRELWCSYIAHASANAILDDDLRRRLADTRDENFRGALAECLVPWFFDHKLGIRLKRHDAGQGSRRPDFEGENSLRVEVKAPHVPIPGQTWTGDNSDTLRACIVDAGRQFKRGAMNVVVVVPLLRAPVWGQRSQLLEAVVGRFALSVPISLDPQTPRQEPQSVFIQDGKLAKLFPSTDGRAKTDLTRVSAVATIEEEFVRRENGTPEIRHNVLVAHNPFSPEATRLPREMFGAFPQLMLDDDHQIGWSDGALLFP
jgi:hypothetical protein